MQSHSVFRGTDLVVMGALLLPGDYAWLPVGSGAEAQVNRLRESPVRQQARPSWQP